MIVELLLIGILQLFFNC